MSPSSDRMSALEYRAHRDRQVAESFGDDAERYDRARPDYPPALIASILAGSPGTRILDVGCGTGIAARQFKAAGCTVLGVEIDRRMAELARRTEIDVEVAAFETWDAANRTFDAIVSGQAWHWIDPIAGAAKAARLLRPDGRLAVFWNGFYVPPGLDEAFAEVYGRVASGLTLHRRGMPDPDGYSEICAVAADGMREADQLREPEQWRYDWERRYTRAEWLDQLPTFGDHSQLSADDLRTISAGIGGAIDAAGGSFTMRYITLAVTAVRAGDTATVPVTSSRAPRRHPYGLVEAAAQQFYDQARSGAGSSVAELNETLKRVLESRINIPRTHPAERTVAILRRRKQALLGALTIGAMTELATRLSAFHAAHGTLVPDAGDLIGRPPSSCPTQLFLAAGRYWLTRAAEQFWDTVVADPNHHYHALLHAFDAIQHETDSAAVAAAEHHGPDLPTKSLDKRVAFTALASAERFPVMSGRTFFISALVENFDIEVAQNLVAHGVRRVRALGRKPTAAEFREGIAQLVGNARAVSTVTRSKEQLRMAFDHPASALAAWERGSRAEDPLAGPSPRVEFLRHTGYFGAEPRRRAGHCAGTIAFRISDSATERVLRALFMDLTGRPWDGETIDAVTFLVVLGESLASDTIYSDWPVTADGSPVGLDDRRPAVDLEALEGLAADHGIATFGLAALGTDDSVSAEFVTAVVDLAHNGLQVDEIRVGRTDRNRRWWLDIAVTATPGRLHAIAVNPELCANAYINVELQWDKLHDRLPGYVETFDGLVRHHVGEALAARISTVQYLNAEQQLRAFHRTRGYRSEYRIWLTTQFSRWAFPEGRFDIVRATTEAIAVPAPATPAAQHLRTWITSTLGVVSVSDRASCAACSRYASKEPGHRDR